MNLAKNTEYVADKCPIMGGAGVESALKCDLEMPHPISVNFDMAISAEHHKAKQIRRSRESGDGAEFISSGLKTSSFPGYFTCIR